MVKRILIKIAFEVFGTAAVLWQGLDVYERKTICALQMKRDPITTIGSTNGSYVRCLSQFHILGRSEICQNGKIDYMIIIGPEGAIGPACSYFLWLVLLLSHLPSEPLDFVSRAWGRRWVDSPRNCSHRARSPWCLWRCLSDTRAHLCLSGWRSFVSWVDGCRLYQSLSFHSILLARARSRPLCLLVLFLTQGGRL